MYAGSGICDALAVRTNMIEKSVYIVTIDMKEYSPIIDKIPQTTCVEIIG